MKEEDVFIWIILILIIKKISACHLFFDFDSFRRDSLELDLFCGIIILQKMKENMPPGSATLY